MNIKKLIALVIVLGCLSILFFRVDSANNKGVSQRREAFPNVADKVATVVIEKGTDSIELKVENDHWVVPIRAGYAADSGKINGLILGVSALNLYNLITDKAERYEVLGVSDDIKKSGKVKISFFDQENKALGSIFIGDKSKSNAPNAAYGMVSYYVRKEGDRNVYMVGESPAIQTNPEYWLSSQILNIEQDSVRFVSQGDISNGGRDIQFEIERNPDIGEEEPFRLVGTDSGMEGNGEVVGLIASGLVNLRLQDVIKSDSEIARSLNFDKATDYWLINGLKYQVSSSVRDSSIYIKIEVSYFKSTAEKASTDQDQSGSQQASSAPAFDGAQEAQRQNLQFSGWIYKVPEYIGTKFRKTIEDVTKKKSEDN